jgi:hypothetical protein
VRFQPFHRCRVRVRVRNRNRSGSSGCARLEDQFDYDYRSAFASLNTTTNTNSAAALQAAGLGGGVINPGRWPGLLSIAPSGRRPNPQHISSVSRRIANAIPGLKGRRKIARGNAPGMAVPPRPSPVRAAPSHAPGWEKAPIAAALQAAGRG